MAKIIKKHSALKKEYFALTRRIKRAVRLALIFVLLSIVGSVLMNYDKLFTVGMILTAVSVTGFIGSIIFAVLRHTDATVLRCGIEGENAAAEALSSLPSGYFCFQNVVVTSDGKESELDLVVVGKTGVFIIETKNRNGHIKGSYGGQRWTQQKVGRGGNSYSSEFYSPIKQVGTHVFRLARFLRQKGVRVHVKGIVYFSGSESVRISGREGEIPVITTETVLKKRILAGDGNLSEDTVQQICKLLGYDEVLQS